MRDSNFAPYQEDEVELGSAISQRLHSSTRQSWLNESPG